MILLTAFAPFGPKGFLSGTNASEIVLHRVMALAPKRYHTAVLAAGKAGLATYRDLLRMGGWTGLLAMGESGNISSSHVVLEPFANVRASPGLLPPTPWTGSEESMFVSTAEAAKKGSRQSIGAYWCNQIYLEALTWAKAHGSVPAAFVHVPAVLGASIPVYKGRVSALYDRYAAEVIDILKQMEARSGRHSV